MNNPAGLHLRIANECPNYGVHLSHSSAQVILKQGETDMGDKGKKDKGKREQQKKSQVTPKEKRKLKKEKKK